LLFVDFPVAILIGAVIWAVALALVVRGARRFQRDVLATRL
jgi:type IV secretory pathway TrbD component